MILKNQSLLNSDALVYYLDLTRDNELNVAEKQNMLKFKGLTKKLKDLKESVGFSF